MSKYYFCLNNEVTFSPTERLLSRCDMSIKPEILNAPSSKILEILLTNTDITPHKTLYENAWEDKGTKTTPNNLYQNISLLRRALNAIFINDDEHISTIPRKGFYFNPDISIEFIGIDTQCEVEEVESCSDISEAKYLPSELMLTPSTSQNDAFPKRSHRYGLVFLVSCCLLLLTTLAFGLINKEKELSYFSTYKPYGKVDNCSFYFPFSTKNGSIEKKLIKSINKSCKNNSYLYVTYMKGLSTFSVISCSNNITDKKSGNACVSWYYKGLLNNDV
jgi:DNA-binding winged-HTH domains